MVVRTRPRPRPRSNDMSSGLEMRVAADDRSSMPTHSAGKYVCMYVCIYVNIGGVEARMTEKVTRKGAEQAKG